MKKKISLVLALCLTLSMLGGCGKPKAEESYEPTGDAIVMSDADLETMPDEREPQSVTLGYDPSRSLNPMIGLDISNRALFSLIYQGLFAVNSYNEPTPILFYDPVTGAVGAAHAGWRGTAKAIGARTVEAMAREYGSRPEDLRCAIGPNVGKCHFETNADVPEAMISAFGPEVQAYIEKKGEKFYLDLKQINAMVLRKAGVRHIEISDQCTMCSPELFWSHRITGQDRGSQGAVIVCREAEA